MDFLFSEKLDNGNWDPSPAPIPLPLRAGGEACDRCFTTKMQYLQTVRDAIQEFHSEARVACRCFQTPGANPDFLQQFFLSKPFLGKCSLERLGKRHQVLPRQLSKGALWKLSVCCAAVIEGSGNCSVLKLDAQCMDVFGGVNAVVLHDAFKGIFGEGDLRGVFRSILCPLASSAFCLK